MGLPAGSTLNKHGIPAHRHFHLLESSKSSTCDAGGGGRATAANGDIILEPREHKNRYANLAAPVKMFKKELQVRVMVWEVPLTFWMGAEVGRKMGKIKTSTTEMHLMHAACHGDASGGTREAVAGLPIRLRRTRPATRPIVAPKW